MHEISRIDIDLAEFSLSAEFIFYLEHKLPLKIAEELSHFSTNRFIEIDELKLDLGEIDTDELSVQHFEYLFMQSLRQSLNKLFPDQYKIWSQAQVIAYFLSYGSYPFSLGKEEELWNGISEETLAELHLLWEKEGRPLTWIKRMAFQMQNEQIGSLEVVVGRDLWEKHRGLTKVVAKELTKSTEEALYQLFAEYILSTTLNEQDATSYLHYIAEHLKSLKELEQDASGELLSVLGFNYSSIDKRLSGRYKQLSRENDVTSATTLPEFEWVDFVRWLKKTALNERIDGSVLQILSQMLPEQMFHRFLDALMEASIDNSVQIPLGLIALLKESSIFTKWNDWYDIIFEIPAAFNSEMALQLKWYKRIQLKLRATEIKLEPRQLKGKSLEVIQAFKQVQVKQEDVEGLREEQKGLIQSYLWHGLPPLAIIKTEVSPAIAQEYALQLLSEYAVKRGVEGVVFWRRWNAFFNVALTIEAFLSYNQHPQPIDQIVRYWKLSFADDSASIMQEATFLEWILSLEEGIWNGSSSTDSSVLLKELDKIIAFKELRTAEQVKATEKLSEFGAFNESDIQYTAAKDQTTVSYLKQEEIFNELLLNDLRKALKEGSLVEILEQLQAVAKNRFGYEAVAQELRTGEGQEISSQLGGRLEGLLQKLGEISRQEVSDTEAIWRALSWFLAWEDYVKALRGWTERQFVGTGASFDAWWKQKQPSSSSLKDWQQELKGWFEGLYGDLDNKAMFSGDLSASDGQLTLPANAVELLLNDLRKSLKEGSLVEILEQLQAVAKNRFEYEAVAQELRTGEGQEISRQLGGRLEGLLQKLGEISRQEVSDTEAIWRALSWFLAWEDYVKALRGWTERQFVGTGASFDAWWKQKQPSSSSLKDWQQELKGWFEGLYRALQTSVKSQRDELERETSFSFIIELLEDDSTEEELKLIIARFEQVIKHQKEPFIAWLKQQEIVFTLLMAMVNKLPLSAVKTLLDAFFSQDDAYKQIMQQSSFITQADALQRLYLQFLSIRSAAFDRAKKAAIHRQSQHLQKDTEEKKLPDVPSSKGYIVQFRNIAAAYLIGGRKTASITRIRQIVRHLLTHQKEMLRWYLSALQASDRLILWLSRMLEREAFLALLGLILDSQRFTKLWREALLKADLDKYYSLLALLLREKEADPSDLPEGNKDVDLREQHFELTDSGVKDSWQQFENFLRYGYWDGPFLGTLDDFISEQLPIAQQRLKASIFESDASYSNILRLIFSLSESVLIDLFKLLLGEEYVKPLSWITDSLKNEYKYIHRILARFIYEMHLRSLLVTEFFEEKKLFAYLVKHAEMFLSIEHLFEHISDWKTLFSMMAWTPVQQYALLSSLSQKNLKENWLQSLTEHPVLFLTNLRSLVFEYEDENLVSELLQLLKLNHKEWQQKYAFSLVERQILDQLYTQPLDSAGLLWDTRELLNNYIGESALSTLKALNISYLEEEWPIIKGEAKRWAENQQEIEKSIDAIFLSEQHPFYDSSTNGFELWLNKRIDRLINRKIAVKNIDFENDKSLERRLLKFSKDKIISFIKRIVYTQKNNKNDILLEKAVKQLKKIELIKFISLVLKGYIIHDKMRVFFEKIMQTKYKRVDVADYYLEHDHVTKVERALHQFLFEPDKLNLAFLRLNYDVIAEHAWEHQQLSSLLTKLYRISGYESVIEFLSTTIQPTKLAELISECREKESFVYDGEEGEEADLLTRLIVDHIIKQKVLVQGADYSIKELATDQKREYVHELLNDSTTITSVQAHQLLGFILIDKEFSSMLRSAYQAYSNKGSIDYEMIQVLDHYEAELFFEHLQPDWWSFYRQKKTKWSTIHYGFSDKVSNANALMIYLVRYFKRGEDSLHLLKQLSAFYVSEFLLNKQQLASLPNYPKAWIETYANEKHSPKSASYVERRTILGRMTLALLHEWRYGQMPWWISPDERLQFTNQEVRNKVALQLIEALSHWWEESPDHLQQQIVLKIYQNTDWVVAFERQLVDHYRSIERVYSAFKATYALSKDEQQLKDRARVILVIWNEFRYLHDEKRSDVVDLWRTEIDKKQLRATFLASREALIQQKKALKEGNRVAFSMPKFWSAVLVGGPLESYKRAMFETLDSSIVTIKQWIRKQPILVQAMSRKLLSEEMFLKPLYSHLPAKFRSLVLYALHPYQLSVAISQWELFEQQVDLVVFLQANQKDELKKYVFSHIVRTFAQGYVASYEDSISHYLEFIEKEDNDENDADENPLFRTLEEEESALIQSITTQIDELSDAAVELSIEAPSNEKQNIVEPSELPDIDRMIVPYAGLVLLGPYLSRYFDLLGLLESNRKAFKGLEETCKGVYALHLLTGLEEEPHEPELLLHKIICGLPLNLPLPPMPTFSQEERSIAQSLLQGAKNNWPKMQRSSIEALQETFIRREGFLSIDEKNIQLYIERKTVDILLQSLPWSFSTLKLPWMELPLQTEWV